MSQEITLEEWLAELERLQKSTTEGMTCREIAIALKRSFNWTDKMLTEAYNLDLIESAGRKRMPSRDGSFRPVPCYRLVRPSGKKRK